MKRLPRPFTTLAIVGLGAVLTLTACGNQRAATVDQVRLNGTDGWSLSGSTVTSFSTTAGSSTVLATLPVPAQNVDDVVSSAKSIDLVAVVNGNPALYATADGGVTWTSEAVPDVPGVAPAGDARFTKRNGQVAGLAVRSISTSNFSAGEWLRPETGGTWSRHPLPAGGTVTAAGAELLLIGGPQLTSLYRSDDAGTAWTESPGITACTGPGAALGGLGSLDTSTLALTGVVPSATGTSAKVTVCMSTDNGQTWTALTTDTIPQALEPGTPLPSGVAGGVAWYAAPDGSQVVIVTSAGTSTSVAPTGLPSGVTALSPTDATHATAVASTTSCPSGKSSCTTTFSTLVTSDAGKTWTHA